MAAPFQDDSRNDHPAYESYTITPSDSSDLPHNTRGLYIGVAGTLKFTTISGTVDYYSSAAQGYHPLMCKRVFSTSTSASDIHGLW